MIFFQLFNITNGKNRKKIKTNEKGVHQHLGATAKCWLTPKNLLTPKCWSTPEENMSNTKTPEDLLSLFTLFCAFFLFVTKNMSKHQKG